MNKYTTYLVDRLVEEKNPKVRARYSTDHKELDRLSRHEDPSVARFVAINKSTHHTTLDRLSRSEDPVVVHTVAKNTSTSEDTLLSLSSLAMSENNYNLAQKVLSNASMSAKSLDRFYSNASNLDNKHNWIHYSIAQNPSAHHTTLDKLSNHEDPYVAQRVAENPSTNPATLKALTRHEHPMVVASATDDHKVLDTLADHEDWMVVSSVARSRHASSDLLNRLAFHEDWEVGEAVAKNPKTSDGTLRELANHHDSRQVYRLARESLSNRGIS